MAFKYSNNASSTLTASITADATSIAIQAGDAGEFPTTSNGDMFALTLVDGTGVSEIVWATARVGGVLTVVRAQEGTTAKPFVANTRVDLRLTAAGLTNFAQLGSDGKILPSQTQSINAELAEAEIDETPADNDAFVGVKSGSGAALFRTTWAGIKAALKAYFDAIYATPANIATAISGTMNGRAYPRAVGGGAMNFNFSGQAGQPSWVWGSADGTNILVWNPAAFNVSSVGGWTQATIAQQIQAVSAANAEARASAYYNAALGQILPTIANAAAGGTGQVGMYLFVMRVGGGGMNEGDGRAGSELRYTGTDEVVGATPTGSYRIYGKTGSAGKGTLACRFN